MRDFPVKTEFTTQENKTWNSNDSAKMAEQILRGNTDFERNKIIDLGVSNMQNRMKRVDNMHQRIFDNQDTWKKCIKKN